MSETGIKIPKSSSGPVIIRARHSNAQHSTAKALISCPVLNKTGLYDQVLSCLEWYGTMLYSSDCLALRAYVSLHLLHHVHLSFVIAQPLVSSQRCSQVLVPQRLHRELRRHRRHAGVREDCNCNFCKLLPWTLEPTLILFGERPRDIDKTSATEINVYFAARYDCVASAACS